ncbi:MAG: penicillin acylase family protein, partial [Nitriliruptorales bacterium]|nr:penicillin acylase family protein [Nitriliruptorales bacterium]
HYVHDGECVPMDRRIIREAPVPLPGEEALPDIIVERTIHGPLVARGRLDGVAVAVARKRSTYLKELDPGVSILKINRGEARSARDFVEIFRESHNLSTNWGWISDSELGYSHGGLYPIRPTDVHPDFPVWGTGQWEWETDEDGNEVFLGLDEVPHETNPERDYIFSWNHRPAPGWGAVDTGWNYSAIYRADLLEDKLLELEKGTVTPVDVVQIMEEAALSDLRGTHVYPLALRIMQEHGSPTSSREAAMFDLLMDWIEDEALRRDGDQDGAYDHNPAVAIADAWWNPMIDAIYTPALGQNVNNVSRAGRHNAPGSGGSAFQGGFYGQVWTDLATVLGHDVQSPTSQAFCGSEGLGEDGTPADCATALWEALAIAGDALGGDDPTAWGVDRSAEDIIFLPNATLTMHWVNRPTTQAFAQFSADESLDPGVDAGDKTPSTGGGLVALGLLPLLLVAAAARRRGA